MAIRPTVAAAQPEGEDAPVLDGEGIEDVGHQGEGRVISDQPGVSRRRQGFSCPWLRLISMFQSPP